MASAWVDFTLTNVAGNDYAVGFAKTRTMDAPPSGGGRRSFKIYEMHVLVTGGNRAAFALNPVVYMQFNNSSMTDYIPMLFEEVTPTGLTFRCRTEMPFTLHDVSPGMAPVMTARMTASAPIAAMRMLI